MRPRAGAGQSSRAWRALRVAAGSLLLASGCSYFHPLQADLGQNAAEVPPMATASLSTLSYYGLLAAAPSGRGEAAPADARAKSAARVGSPAHLPAPPGGVVGADAPFVYLWLARPLAELSLQVLAPARCAGAPREHDEVEAGYVAQASSGATLRPCLRIERCLSGAASPESCRQWRLLAANEEATASSCEGGLQAALRVVPQQEREGVALRRGLYRVQVAHCRGASGEGPFFLQAGAPRSLQGSRWARAPSSRRRASGDARPPPPARARPPFALPVPDSLAPREQASP